MSSWKVQLFPVDTRERTELFILTKHSLFYPYLYTSTLIYYNDLQMCCINMTADLCDKEDEF